MSARDASLDLLIAAYIEGRLSPEEEAALKLRLHEDAQARACFVEMLDLHAMLAGTPAVAGAMLAAADLDDARTSLGNRRAPWWRFAWWAAAAALVALAIGVWQTSRPRVELVGGVGGQFVGRLPPALGSDLVGKDFELSQGLVELHFRQSDATIVIEAPAQFRVEDAKTLRVDSGRITAHVRDGKRGLRVLTPEADVFDLGTRFAVDVTRGRRSEVHVFEGKVEAGVARSGRRQLLAANEALRFEGTARPAACDVRMASFVQPEELRPLAAAFGDGQHSRNQRAFAALASDPAILTALDFEGGDLPEFLEVQGAQPAQGRFPGDTALDFVDVDDNVRLNREAAVRQFTMMTWVRLNGAMPGKDYQASLYHTDLWGTMGQVHWMINGNGQLRFAIDSREPIGFRGSTALWAESPNSLLETLSRWTHLAVTYDADAREVSFYVNGELDAARTIPKSLTALLGPAEIGNWNPIPGRRRRRLCGRMDELLILSRVLTAAEVQSYYGESTPYR